MTTFAQIELIYKQFDNVNKEIETLIGEENYDDAINKIKENEKLIKKLYLAKKTANLTDDELLILEKRNNVVSANYTDQLEKLKKLHLELNDERLKTKNQIKIKNAYNNSEQENDSIYIDTEE